MATETEGFTVSDSTKALEIVFGKAADGAHSGAMRTEKQQRVKYWRKPEYDGATDSGWIIVGPEIRTDAPGYQLKNQRGWRELPDKYGMQLTGQPDTTMHWEGPDARRNPLSWLEPFIAAQGLTYIIQHNDSFGPVGSYLMPKEQIVALGVHRRPGIKNLRPDLATAVDLECPMGCINDRRVRSVFAGVDQDEAQKNLDQHMVAKHRDSEGARQMGAEITKQTQALGGVGQMNVEMIAAIVAATIKAMQGNTAEPAPSAAVAEEWVEPEPVAELPVPEPVYDPSPRFDIDTATRREMMSFAKTMGIQTLPFKATADVWREYLKEQFAPAA